MTYRAELIDGVAQTYNEFVTLEVDDHGTLHKIESRVPTLRSSFKSDEKNKSAASADCVGFPSRISLNIFTNTVSSYDKCNDLI